MEPAQSGTVSTSTTAAVGHVAPELGPVLGTVREGDTVTAEDGCLGHVERLVRTEAHTPAYLVVRAGRTLRRKYPVVPVSLIARVDPRRRLVELRGRRDTIRRLPETLPFVL